MDGGAEQWRDLIDKVSRTFSFYSGHEIWLHVSGGEAQATALHADLKAVSRLTACIDNAAVHVTWQVAIGAFPRAAAAAADARILGAAGATSGTVQHDVAEGQELTEEAGEDAVDTAIWKQKEKGISKSKQKRAKCGKLKPGMERSDCTRVRRQEETEDTIVHSILQRHCSKNLLMLRKA